MDWDVVQRVLGIIASVWVVYSSCMFLRSDTKKHCFLAVLADIALLTCNIVLGEAMFINIILLIAVFVLTGVLAFGDYPTKEESNAQQGEDEALAQAEAALELLESLDRDDETEVQYKELKEGVERLRGLVTARDARQKVRAVGLASVLGKLKDRISHAEAEEEVQRLGK